MFFLGPKIWSKINNDLKKVLKFFYSYPKERNVK